MTNYFKEDDYLISFHSLQDVVVSDTREQRRQSLLRKSLGWDSAFFTREGLLNPEELVMVNKGFKKSNSATQKDAKISNKTAGSFKKMNICSQNKDKGTSHPKLNSSRQTNNNAAVGRSDNAQDSKMSSTCFTSPTVQKTVHHSYKSPYSAKRLTKSVGCNSFKKTNICSQNKDKVTRLPNNNVAVERSSDGVKIENKTKKVQDSKRSPSGGLPKLTCFTSPPVKKAVHLYELSSSKNSFKSIKGKVDHKNMKVVNSPTSVFHFPASPSSTSPASYVDGESLSSNTVSHQGYEDRKFSSQNATIGSGGPKRKIKSSGPHIPSLKIGLFDEVVDLISQDQSKPDAQISKEILKNRMMSLEQKRLKDDCGSFQTEKHNVHSIKDEANDLSRQLEVIDLKRDVVEVKAQHMRSSFKDDNLQLIDCSEEDDYLIPFPYRNSLEDLRLSGLLNPEELYMINKGFKKSIPTTPKDAERSKVATKIAGNQSNALSCKKMNNAAAVTGSDNAKTEHKTRTAQDSKRSCSGGLPKSTSFTSPAIQKTIHHLHESSFKNVSKSVKNKVNPRNMKLLNSPSSVLNFPMSPSSTSPASSTDGESLSSTPVTRQNAITVLDFQSQDSEERNFIGQNAIKASGLRMPSLRIGFFDMEPGSMQDRFRYIESQFQPSHLSPSISTEKCLKVGKFPSTGNNWINLSGPKRDRLKHIGLGSYKESSIHPRTALAGKML